MGSRGAGAGPTRRSRPMKITDHQGREGDNHQIISDISFWNLRAPGAGLQRNGGAENYVRKVPRACWGVSGLAPMIVPEFDRALGQGTRGLAMRPLPSIHILLRLPVTSPAGPSDRPTSWPPDTHSGCAD